MSVKPGSYEYKCPRFIQTIPTGAVLFVFCVEKLSVHKLYMSSHDICSQGNYSAVLN